MGLQRLVAEARDPRPLGRTPVPPLNRRGVHVAYEPLLTLARRLVEHDDPSPRSVALASYLVCDPNSPAYRTDSGATVAELARTALAAIDHNPLR